VSAAHRNRGPIGLIVVFLLSLLLGLAGQEVASEKATLPSTLPGCYRLSLGRWWPWGFGEDTQFVTPPARIELLTTRGTEGFEQGHSLLRGLPRTPGRRGPSFWEVTPNGGVDLVWKDGFTGITINLRKEGDLLRGRAHPHFDSPVLIKRTAYVTMRKIDCNAQ
jgi:hypothetical protein